MNMFTVVEIGNTYEIDTQYGKKQKVEVKLKEVTTQQVYDTSYFIPKDGFTFKVGEDILADVVVSGKYTNLKSVEKISSPPPPPEKTEEMSKEDWEGKERRGHRRACLAIASSLLTEDMKKELKVPDVELVNMTMLMANKLVDYVYETFDSIEVPKE